MDRRAQREAIRANTRLLVPALCPELSLRGAETLLEVWQAIELANAQGPLPSPFWAFAWPGGQALARYVLDHRDVVHGKRVLDFASGGGVSAIACHRAGAAHVLATEIDPWAIAALEENAEAASATLEIREGDVVDSDGGWEVILAGDVCYRQEPSARIERWLRTLAARGATVLLGDPGRGFTPTLGLRELARYELDTLVDVEGVSRRQPVVWQVLPR